MFKRLIAAFARARERKRSHAAAWSAFIVTDQSGLTQFQHLARSELESALGPLSLELKGDKERYLTGTLPGTEVTIYLYEDGAEIHDSPTELRAERWDYDTPALLISELVARGLKAVQSNNSFKPTPLRGAA